jgi:hypothetical protein
VRPSVSHLHVALASAGLVTRGGSHHSSSEPRGRRETGQGVRAVTLLRRALRVCLTPASERLVRQSAWIGVPLEFFGISLCARDFQSGVCRLYAPGPNAGVTLLCRRALLEIHDTAFSRLTWLRPIIAPMHPGYCPNCGERVTPYAAGCALCGADLDPKRWQKPPAAGQRLSIRLPAGLRRAIRGRGEVRVRGSL